MENTSSEHTDTEISSIFTIKTQVGKEQNTADLINSRAKKGKFNIPSILVTPDLRGYIFVEAFDEELIKNMIKTISY
ncbi:MAG TPA: transcription elongation factor Spt5, partial [Candidatus Thermoplasmatota archaeon]|nr:transcription elongation factor Spt5 [Candidatus Thermoplasmatota archaeon]